MKHCIGIALLAAVATFCIAANASDFTGSTISWQYYAYGGTYNQGTTSGTFVDNGTIGGTFSDGSSTYFNIIAGPNYLEFDYSVDTKGSTNWSASSLSLPPNLYNGVDLRFTGPNITSVTIDGATNMAGFNSSFIYFTSDEIQVDWHNLPFNSDTIVKLDLNGSTATPEPGSLLLFGSAVLAGAGILRRRLNA